MGVEVRVAQSDEVERVVTMYEWLFAAPGSLPPHWNPTEAAERLHRLLANPRGRLLVADVDAVLVGFATVYLDIDSVRFGQRAWVEDLAVDPAQRSSGIGKRLLDAARDWARAEGASHLELDSGLARVDAHRFYEREMPSWRSMCFGWEL